MHEQMRVAYIQAFHVDVISGHFRVIKTVSIINIVEGHLEGCEEHGTLFFFLLLT